MIKVADITFGRLQSPDLDVAEEFLTDFGMVKVDRTNDRLFMRGTGPDPVIHITHLGDPKFIGLAFRTNNEDDLEKAAKMEGASEIEDLDAPGGGRVVRLTDPHGYSVEIVSGQQPADEIAVPRFKVNDVENHDVRAGVLTRIPPGPSHVQRLGHAVIMTTDIMGGTKWYRDTLGLVASDEVYVEGDKEKVIATFNRIDAGEEFVDHHTFLCVQGEKTGLNHISFQVHDIDDVAMGNAHLKSKEKYDHMWGIGRHVLGSQVFDYWQDPWGRVHEHWTDSDRLNSHNAANIVPAEEGFNSQWGEPVPERFITHATP
jgi:catechol 2,3-dioxygenase-like lactoylglutathione lyase family enzyme